MVTHATVCRRRPRSHTLWLGLVVAARVLLSGLPTAFAEGEDAQVSYHGDLAGRGRDKARWLAQYGGTDASERAVAMGLRWLADHQLPDGGWSFDHARAPACEGKCRNPGELADARNAATALALLPFLGAGQTHKAGIYREEAKAGIDFLVSNMRITEDRGSLYEPGGTMYSHGIGTIALCEAYAMTHDQPLYAPSQRAINFISYAQDPVGGGWRYQPRQKGDTSVTGWQVMALKSAHMAYLRVPPVTVRKSVAFLDSVGADGGAQYGYTEPTAGRPGTTAVGLLLRMYLGWKQHDPALKRGVEWLAELGPSRTNVYYDYYATQVIWHYGGDVWRDWNARMRDNLLQSQSQEGHEAGSWYFEGGDNADLGASRGGRLYSTAMATMILEVYYRYLPIYREMPVDRHPSTEEGPAKPNPASPDRP